MAYPLLLNETLDEIVNETKERVERQAQDVLEDALRLDGLTLEQFRDQMKPQAEMRVKRSLVLSKLAEQEGVAVSDDEVVQEYRNLLSRIGGMVEQLTDRTVDVDSALGRNLRSNVLGRKVMSRLTAIGREVRLRWLRLKLRPVPRRL